MQENFLKRFIEEEKYLQNPPLNAEEFIKFCEVRGIKTNKNELEFFEKEKLLYPIFRSENPVIEDPISRFGDREPFRYVYPEFKEGKYYKNLLIEFVEKGHLFDPSTKPFREWSSFEGKELINGSEKISSFYSSFQIYWLIMLKESYSFNVNLASGKIIVSSSLSRFNWPISDFFTIESFSEFERGLDKACESVLGKFVFNLERKKQELAKECEKFEKLLEFLLSIQFVYSSYGMSSSKSIRINEKWWENRLNFNSKEELNVLGLDIKYVYDWYVYFSKKVVKTFDRRDDWIQLIKNINWDKKDRLEGNLRLEIEYLQCSLMLKRFIEDHCEKEIPDVDEIERYRYSDIINLDFNELEPDRTSLRYVRFDRYGDYYHDKYKRLYYLANEFEINYQPRVIVFVEGLIEEKLFTQFFEWVGNKPQNSGIQIINLGGITKFFSKKINLKDPISNRYEQAYLSNLSNLISYNLRKWQIMPFFIGDDENNIGELLKIGISIKFGGDEFPLPIKWQHIWDKNFEFDNFNDKEISSAISSVLNKHIDIEKVKEIKKTDKYSIDKIDVEIHEKKTIIAQKLYDNLLEEYKKENENKILDRPVFEVINKIKDISHYNYPPTNTLAEIRNKEIILDFLKGKIKD